MFPDRRLSSPPPDSGWSFGGSSSSASGSPSPFPASPRRLSLSLGTSEALSVEEPAQRFSCSRRLVLASPIYASAEDRVFKNKTHTEAAAADTPSMCMLSLPGSLAPGSVLCSRMSVGSCPRAQGTRRAVQACPRDVTTAGFVCSRPRKGNTEIV